MFGIGGFEIALIAIVALLLFGPDKIPQILQTVRKAVDLYSDARSQVTEVVNTQIITPEEQEMLKDPLGLKGVKSSVDSMLTPQRSSLYTQDAAESAQGGSDTSSESAEQQAAPRSSAAGSIWASLEQDKENG
ncbi:MAG: twin-arginine translocase TatA/TatE family subunit [Coriobacteriia bacterium]|nr:twin-arginine translocase TatA/TatE family subunit [Coriobacteriia bacterium]